MVYGIKSIGYELLEVEVAKDFKETYEKLSKSNDFEFNSLQKFFYLSNNLCFQFDGFICIFESLRNENPDVINEYGGLQEFVTKKCGILAIISHLIIFPLNNHIIDEEVFNIIETPYDNFLDKNLVKDEAELKKVFESILKCNVDSLFSQVISLRDDFFSSKLFKGYIDALKTDGDIRKYEIAVQALFYIIKQTIYQIIRYHHLGYINDDHIIQIQRFDSLERDYFKIKYQPSILNNLGARYLMELNHENTSELGFVTFGKTKINQAKGTIVDIEMEILSKEGLNIDSPTNEGINKWYNQFGHMLRFIDPVYRGIE